MCLVTVEVLCNNALFKKKKKKNPLTALSGVMTSTWSGARCVNVGPHGTRSSHVSLREMADGKASTSAYGFFV